MTPIQLKLQDFYASLSDEALNELGEIYSPDVEFVDPVNSHKGLAQLTTYFSHLLSNCHTCKFDIHGYDNCGQTLFIRWTMHYAHPKLKNAQQLSLDGISELHIRDERVYYQRDYYDMGAMLYEHIPVIGAVIRWLKGRLSQ